MSWTVARVHWSLGQLPPGWAAPRATGATGETTAIAAAARPQRIFAFTGAPPSFGRDSDTPPGEQFATNHPKPFRGSFVGCSPGDRLPTSEAWLVVGNRRARAGGQAHALVPELKTSNVADVTEQTRAAGPAT